VRPWLVAVVTVVPVIGVGYGWETCTRLAIRVSSLRRGSARCCRVRRCRLR